jgi:hypothetical protein
MNTTPITARGPLFQPAYYRPWLRFIDSTDAADGGAGGGDDKGKQGDEGKTFTQEDLDKYAAKVRGEERRKASERFADYDDLKTQAAGAKTVEQKLEELTQKHAAAEARALRSDIAAAHGISAEDRDLFLTGTDEETLTAQAKRLSEREADRKKQGNRAPNEGKTPLLKADDERAAVRSLFGGGQ